MKRLTETLVFLALAACVHLAFALQFRDGSGAGGVGGIDLISLQAASESVETMVARWEQPPTVAEAPETPELDTVDTEAPAPSAAPDLPVLRTAAVALPSAAPGVQPDVTLDLRMPTAMVPPDTAQPRMPQPPAPVQVRPTPRPETRPTPRPERQPELQPTPPDSSPVAEVESADPPPPEAKPEPVKPKAKAAAKAAPASSAQAKLKSAGSGGTRQAGAAGKAGAPTLSKGQRARAITVWSSQIRTRIERRKVSPRGAQKVGRVQLMLTVSRDGRVQGVRVIRSSGVAAIDKAALNSVARAGRMPKAPKGLTDPSYSFRLPMDFR